MGSRLQTLWGWSKRAHQTAHDEAGAQGISVGQAQRVCLESKLTGEGLSQDAQKRGVE